MVSPRAPRLLATSFKGPAAAENTSPVPLARLENVPLAEVMEIAQRKKLGEWLKGRLNDRTAELYALASVRPSTRRSGVSKQ